MEVKGNLIKKVGERSGVGQNGPWKFASYLLDTVEMRDSFPVHRKMVIDVSDGEVGRIAKFDTMFGRDVVVRFDIDADEYQGRWYNHIRAYGIREVEPEEKQASQQVQQAGNDPFPPQGDNLGF
jgi:hypothetical protein